MTQRDPESFLERCVPTMVSHDPGTSPPPLEEYASEASSGNENFTNSRAASRCAVPIPGRSDQSEAQGDKHRGDGDGGGLGPQDERPEAHLG